MATVTLKVLLSLVADDSLSSDLEVKILCPEFLSLVAHENRKNILGCLFFSCFFKMEV